MSQERPVGGAASVSEDGSRRTADPSRARVEWATLAVSVTLLLALVATLVHAQLAGGGSAAIPRVEARAETDRAVRQPDGFHLPLRIQNRGRAAAREIQIRVQASAASGPSSDPIDLLLDVLPAGATEAAYVVLPSDPLRTSVEVRVISYVAD